MYNKVKKCLESMVYGFVECESVELKTGIKLSKGFWGIMPHRHKELYIDISDNGYIDIWDYKSGEHYYSIKKKKENFM